MRAIIATLALLPAGLWSVADRGYCTETHTYVRSSESVTLRPRGFVPERSDRRSEAGVSFLLGAGLLTAGLLIRRLCGRGSRQPEIDAGAGTEPVPVPTARHFVR